MKIEATETIAVTDHSVRIVTARENAEVRAQEMVREAETAREADRSARAKADLREEKEMMRLSWREWKQNLTRRILKSAIITKKKEINLLSWKAAAAQARRTRKECSSVPLKRPQSQRSITNLSRQL